MPTPLSSRICIFTGQFTGSTLVTLASAPFSISRTSPGSTVLAGAPVPSRMLAKIWICLGVLARRRRQKQTDTDGRGEQLHTHGGASIQGWQDWFG